MRLKFSCLLFLGCLFLSIPSLKAQTTPVDSIIRYAQDYLDTPYRRGGSSPKAFDCSGFSCFVFKHFGYELNRSSCDQAKNGIEVSKNSLKPGDLILFKGRNTKKGRIGHVGIVIESDGQGEVRFIHASVTSGVTINDINQPYYKTRYITGRRILKNDENENRL